MTQAARHASVCAYLGTTPRDYNGDFHALFDADGIAGSDFNGRLLAWINNRLGTSITNLPGAMDAYAAARGAGSWNDLGDMGLTSNATALTFSRNVFANGGWLDPREVPLLTTFFAGMTTDTLAAIMDRLWILGLRNSIASRTSLYGGQIATEVGAPAHTPNVGYAFPATNPTTGYLLTDYVPSALTGVMTLNSNHLAVWALTELADVGADIGATGTAAANTLRMCVLNATAGINRGNGNSAGASPSSGVASSLGLTLSTRRAASGAAATEVYRDTASLAEATTASVALPTVAVAIGTYNNNGAFDQRSPGRSLFMASLGSGMSDANVAAFHGRLATLKTALNALA